MADGNISQITLPNGNTYDIKDAEARQMTLSGTYTSATLDLELELAAADVADNEEF